MKDYTTTWNKSELKAYLLLYCSQADFIETQEETAMIKNKIDPVTLKSIQSEFNQDNDFQRIQKVTSTINRLHYSKEQVDELIKEIMEFFLTDGKFDILEKNLLGGLKRILSI